MSVNDLFIKGNKLFLEKNFIGGLDVFKEILAQFPKNKRLEEEINKKIKKFKQPIVQTHSKLEIKNFFNMQKLGKSSIVIKKLSDTLEKKSKLRIFFEKSKENLCIPFYPDNQQTLSKIT